MEKNKPFFYRVVACFCAFMICLCLVVFAFMIPPKSVKATSVYDQWEDWVDDRLFEGSSFWIEEFVSKGIENMGGELFYIGVVGALNMIESPDSDVISLNSIGCLQGYYYYSGSKYLCQTVYRNDNYSSADGGISVATGTHFDLRCVLTATTPFSFIKCQQYDSSSYRYLNVDGRGGSSPYYRSITGGGSIFPNLDDNQYGFQVRYDTSTPTYLTDNMSTSAYVPGAGYVPTTIAGGFGSNTVIINDDSDFNPTFHLNPDGKIPVEEIIDFIPDFNVWILQEFPDIDPDILFVPIIIPDGSDSTDGSGCNCVHNIYVDVTCYYDPEINVYVTEYFTINNNFELPSDWVEDYTLTTDPTEFSPPIMPTDPSTTMEIEMPTIDQEEVQEQFGQGFLFWLWLAKKAITDLGLELLTSAAFVIAVVGFVLWRLGSSGGGSDD